MNQKEFNGSQDYWNKEARRYDLAIKLLNPNFISDDSNLIPWSLINDKTVLEVACGTGLITVHLFSAKKLIISDVSESMLEICQHRLSKLGKKPDEAHLASALDLPFDDQTIEVLVCGNLLHLLADPKQALSEFKRVLVPGEVLISPTFCHGHNILSKSVSYILRASGFPVVSRFRGPDLITTISSGGFKVVKQELIAGIIPVKNVISVVGA